MTAPSPDWDAGRGQRGSVPWLRRATLCALALLVLAPTPGDVGGCSQPAEELDPEAFAEARRAADCAACKECEISGERCEAACDGETRRESEFPPGCLPLVHDGQVCLRALRHSTCSAYEQYMSDVTPTIPSECDFCPLELQPE